MANNADNFEHLMREHIRSLSAYAHSISPTRDIAEDAIQETFIRAWRYSESYRGDAPVLSWLVAICRRVVIDLVQYGHRHQHQELTEETPALTDPFEFSALTDLVGALPLAQREVLVLCAILGFDYDTAADVLSIPVGTVRSRLSRARESLSVALQQATAV